MGKLYHDWGRPNEAEAVYRRGIEIEMKVMGRSIRSLPPSLNALVNQYREQGKLDEAETLIREIVRVQESVMGAQFTPMVRAMLTWRMSWSSWAKRGG